MELIKYLRESCKKRQNIKPTFKFLGTVGKEEIRRPLCNMTNIKAMTLILSWLAWHGKNRNYVKIRLKDQKESKVYTAGILQKKGKICVRCMRHNPEMGDKILHHWYHNITYQNLFIKEIRNSIDNADTLNMMSTVCNINENISDSDLEI